MRKKIVSEKLPEITFADAQLRMMDAITNVLTGSRKEYFDQLTDDELFGYAKVLWDFHTDMRDEFARRELMKASHTWAGELGK